MTLQPDVTFCKVCTCNLIRHAFGLQPSACHCMPHRPLARCTRVTGQGHTFTMLSAVDPPHSSKTCNCLPLVHTHTACASLSLHRRTQSRMLSFMVAAVPSLTFMQQCAGSFLAAKLNLGKFDLYDTWFDANSTMKLAQTGVYRGPDDILEYSKFIFPGSSYVSVNGLFRSDNSLLSFDEEKRSCTFMRMNHNRFEFSEMANYDLHEFNALLTMEWRFDDQKIGNIHVHCAPPVSSVAHTGPAPRAMLCG